MLHEWAVLTGKVKKKPLWAHQSKTMHSTNTLEHALTSSKGMLNEHVFMILVSLIEIPTLVDLGISQDSACIRY